jgi:PleD family two-component response regulator
MDKEELDKLRKEIDPKKLNILVVDDDKFVCRPVGKTLRDEGYNGLYLLSFICDGICMSLKLSV